MYELFQTWKQPPPHSNAPFLFASEQIKRLDDFLIRARKYQNNGPDSIKQNPPPQTLQQHAQAFISNQHHGLPQRDLLIAVDRLIELTNQRKALSPLDVDAQAQIQVLYKLKEVLSTQSLPPTILPAIQDKLMGFTRKELERLNNRSTPMVHQMLPLQQQPGLGQGQSGQPPLDLSRLGPLVQQMMMGQQGQNYPQNYGLSQPNLGVSANPPNYSQANFGGLANPMAGLFANGNSGQPNTPVIPESLLSSLKTAGLVSNGIVFKVELSNAELLKPRPELVENFLYKNLPKQCSTCGKRYRDDAKGHEAREKHLDWHFRVNKCLREGNRAVNRCWYLTEQEWIEYHDEDEILGLVQLDHVRSDKDEKLDLEVLAKKYVPVPGDKTISRNCPICKDKFETQWSDEAEDWVWINAIEEKGKYFHAICHAESQMGKKKDGKEREKRLQASTDSQQDSPVIHTPTPQPVLPQGLDLAAILSNANSKRKFEGDDGRDAKREKFAI